MFGIDFLQARNGRNPQFAALADFLESVPRACPHDLFKRDEGARASKLPHEFLALDRLIVMEKRNTATDAEALIIPGAHEELCDRVREDGTVKTRGTLKSGAAAYGRTSGEV